MSSNPEDGNYPSQQQPGQSRRGFLRNATLAGAGAAALGAVGAPAFGASAASASKIKTGTWNPDPAAPRFTLAVMPDTQFFQLMATGSGPPGGARRRPRPRTG